ncbi:hypothetical protein EVAR_80113_1 [Eumeta japonica]|uniref:Uncharacterized protein n=1 Tax=Eumeta variegata TaxID=151549 RepID=A0A4C1UDQ6_EUMVA|nr:hypothetical protein EVAR_80113_1 [Eumeta japonica]
MACSHDLQTEMNNFTEYKTPLTVHDQVINFVKPGDHPQCFIAYRLIPISWLVPVWINFSAPCFRRTRSSKPPPFKAARAADSTREYTHSFDCCCGHLPEYCGAVRLY